MLCLSLIARFLFSTVIFACSQQQHNPEKGEVLLENTSKPFVAMSKKTEEKGPGFPIWAMIGKQKKITHTPAVRTKSKCGFEIIAKNLNALSDKLLQQQGLGGTPIVILENGSELKGFGGKKAHGEECSGMSTFHFRKVVFSPSKGPASQTKPQDYQIALSSQAPLITPKGPQWWVYRRHRLVAQFSDGNPLAGTKIKFEVRARIIGKMGRDLPKLMMGEQNITFTASDNVLTASAEWTVPADAWTVSIWSPNQGSYLVVESFDLIQNGQKWSLLNKQI